MKNNNAIPRRLAIFMPDLRVGGAERVAVNIANEFSSRGYKVDVVLLSASGKFLEDLISDVQVVDLKSSRFLKAIFPLCRYLKEAKPDAMLAFMWPLTSIVIWAKILTFSICRVVVVEQTTWSTGEIFKSFVHRWIAKITMRITFPFADNVVTASKGSADDLANFAMICRNNITVIFNPIIGVKEELSDDSHHPIDWWMGAHYRILAVGALKVVKDYPTLINAFSIIKKNCNARLLIIGEGSCRLSLESQIKQLGLFDSVFMPGFVRDQIPYYHRADLHVLSSIGEGLPTVLVEALAAGTPVVSTDCLSGPSEILCDGKFGKLVPVGDSVALASAIESSLNTKHDYEFLKARAQDFTIQNAVDKYEVLLFE